MKHRLVILCLMIAFAIHAAAQVPANEMQGDFSKTNLVETAPGPTYTDTYCSGFITNRSIPRSNYVVAGWESPDAVRFADRDYVYIGGPQLQEGAEYIVVRELRDPNHYEAFPGQYASINSLGSPYADIAHIKVLTHRNRVTVAQVTFSCEPIATGDTVVPLVERPKVLFRPTYPFDRFAPPNGKMMGRVVMARDFDLYFANGRKVYLDIGADKGVQVGDYYRVVRSADRTAGLKIDAISAKADLAEDTQKHPMNKRDFSMEKSLRDFPRRNLGEMVILNVYPKSAVGMVTFTFEEMMVGDTVELEDMPPPPPPPPPPPAPRAPQISCAARPTSVQAGESSNINCEALSADNRPVEVAFTTSTGKISPNGVLDTRGTAPGPITVTATATDDRNMSASARTTVTVLAPAAPPAASKTAEIAFKPNSSYVDNRAKALLDDLALRMQREPDAKVVINGHGPAGTPAGTRLANMRGNNAKSYLTKSKGIDDARITTKGSAGNDSAEIWWVPAGAQPPQ